MPICLEEAEEWFPVVPDEPEGEHRVYDGQQLRFTTDQFEQLATLLGLIWRGDRHYLALGVGGVLAKCGYHPADAERLVSIVAGKAGDTELNDRLTAVRDSYLNASLGKPVKAWQELKERMGEDSLDYLSTLLKVEKQPDRPPPPPPPSVAPDVRDPYKMPFRMTERQAFPTFPMLMRGILPSDPRGVVGYLTGYSQSFKSYLALDWACHVSEGMEWSGHETTQAEVLYVAAEGQYADLLSRLRAWETHHGRRAENLFCRLAPVKLTDKESVAEAIALTKRLDGFKPRLVILDTLNQCAGDTDDNSSADARIIYAACKEFGMEFGSTVMLLCHKGKSEGAIIRGSSAYFDDCDFCYEIQRPCWMTGGLDATLNCRKIKRGKMIFNYELKAREVKWEADGETGSDLVLLQKVMDKFRALPVEEIRNDRGGVD
jgi:hypothetical protein